MISLNVIYIYFRNMDLLFKSFCRIINPTPVNLLCYHSLNTLCIKCQIRVQPSSHQDRDELVTETLLPFSLINITPLRFRIFIIFTEEKYKLHSVCSHD